MQATKTRKAERHRRRQLLKQIDQWEAKRCGKCAGSTKNKKDLLCDCEAAVVIRNLGIQLSEQRTSTFSTEQELTPPTPVEELTPESYKRLKEKEFYTDKEIMNHFKMGTIKFAEFKKRHNLIVHSNFLKGRQRHRLSETRVLNGLVPEEYKRLRSMGLVDAAIKDQFDISASTFTRWKRAHGLSKVKRQPKNKEAIQMTTVTTDAIKELSFAENQTTEYVDRNDLQPPRPVLAPADLQILAEQVKPISVSPASDSDYIGKMSVGEPSVQPVNSSSPSGWSVAPAGMQKVEVPESVELKLLQSELDQVKAKLAERDTHIASLEERHVKDGAYIDEIKKDRYDIIARADNWRDKCRLTENELRDKACEIEKLKEQHYIEMTNLQNDLHKAKEVNELLRQDEQLLFLTMKKLVNVNDRAAVSVEGGKDLWR